MASPILLPRQGQSVETCIITEFYVSPGDKVTAGTPLFAYETDKASFEEEAAEEGTILALFFKAGDEVPVLTNVGVIGKEGESFKEFAPDGNATGEAHAAPSDEPKHAPSASETRPSAPDFTPPQPSNKIFITPRARNLAASEGIRYESIVGSGPCGRILEKDIRKAMDVMKGAAEMGVPPQQNSNSATAGSAAFQKSPAQKQTAAEKSYGDDSEIVPLTSVRKLIAGAMLRSLQNSAQLTHHLGADARNILELRQRVKSAQKEGCQNNITINDMICLAVIKTLKDYANANAHFLGDSLRVFKKVHLGIAVDTERGLMVPVIKNADDLSIQGLSSQMKGVAESCRKGNMNPDLLAPEAASFTVSNLGNYGVEMFTPVLNLPQVAILGVNTILPRPKELGNGVYGFVPHLGLSLTYNHQALDGGEATRFLKSIATNIENLDFEL